MRSQIASLLRNTFQNTKWAKPILELKETSAHTPTLTSTQIMSPTPAQGNTSNDIYQNGEPILKRSLVTKISMNGIIDPDNDKYGKTRQNSGGFSLPNLMRGRTSFRKLMLLLGVIGTSIFLLVWLMHKKNETQDEEFLLNE